MRMTSRRRNFVRAMISALSLVTLMFTASCSTKSNGHLVIIGGALSQENELIYGRIIELGGKDPRVAVVPTASGVPEESGPGYVKDFVDRDVPAEVVDITFQKPEEAANPEKAEQIRDSNILFFTGGDQSRILAAFRPASGDTVSYEATRKVLSRGGVIAGSSAGAAMMSDPCLRWGRSEEALLIGVSEAPDRGVGVTRGMGYFPYGLTGQHFLRRGRMGRLLVALEETGLMRGYGVDENKAIEVDLTTHQIVALGDRAVLLIDISDMKRSGLTREAIRLSLLSTGDAVHGLTGDITPGPGKQPYISRRSDKVELDPVEGAWDDYVISDAMIKVAESPATTVVVKSENFDLIFTEDGNTEVYTRPFATVQDDPTIVRLRLDIVARDGATERARALLDEIQKETTSGM